MLLEGKFEFLYPSLLYLLIPVVLLLFLRRREGSSGAIIFGSLLFLSRLGRKPGGRIGFLGMFLIYLAISSGIIALARPQLVNQIDYTKASGIDILIAFDLSGSMEYEDMRLNGYRTNRLTAAKYVVTDFIKKRPNDRIGLVGFAGRPKMFSPLTLDHAIVLNQIELFHPSLMEANGTAIGSAIAAAATRLEERNDTKSKIIILVTDGASNSGELTPLEAAQLARDLDIKIYTIAVGTENPDMPYLTQAQQFDEETLREIVRLTGGQHFRARDTQMFVNAFDSIDELEKSEAKRHTVRRAQELFPYLIALSVLLATIAAFIEILRPRPAP